MRSTREADNAAWVQEPNQGTWPRGAPRPDALPARSKADQARAPSLAASRSSNAQAQPLDGRPTTSAHVVALACFISTSVRLASSRMRRRSRSVKPPALSGVRKPVYRAPHGRTRLEPCLLVFAQSRAGLFRSLGRRGLAFKSRRLAEENKHPLDRWIRRNGLGGTRRPSKGSLRSER